MNKVNILISFLTICLFTFSNLSAQDSEPWTEAQLMNPADLAEMIEENTAEVLPLILAVNPDGMHRLDYEAGIAGAIWFGEAEDEGNLHKLRLYLEEVDRDVEIVLYCGCCPFAMCPNIRPAFELLNAMGFKNHKLLDLPDNIVDDWIDHGYPMKEVD